MGLGHWLKNLLNKKDDVSELMESLICPKCGSKEFGYFTYLANFVEVMREQEKPRYIKSGVCNACGYTKQETLE